MRVGVTRGCARGRAPWGEPDELQARTNGVGGAGGCVMCDREIMLCDEIRHNVREKVLGEMGAPMDDKELGGVKKLEFWQALRVSGRR